MNDTPAQYTNITTQGCSVIDLVWVNDRALDLVVDLKVSDTPTQSSHLPVILTLQVPEYLPRREEKSIIKWKQELFNVYGECIAYCKQVSLLDLSINNMNKNLENSIINISNKIGMIKKPCKFTNKRPWYNLVCKKARNVLNNCLKNCKSDGFSERSLQEYQLSKLAYKKALENLKNLY